MVEERVSVEGAALEGAALEGAALEGDSVVEGAAEGGALVEAAAAVVCAALDLGSAAVVLSPGPELVGLFFCLFLKSRHELSSIGSPQRSVIILEEVVASVSEQPLLIRHCFKRPN